MTSVWKIIVVVDVNEKRSIDRFVKNMIIFMIIFIIIWPIFNTMDLIWSGVKINSVPRGSKSTTLLENGELQREKNYTEVHFNCVFFSLILLGYWWYSANAASDTL